jgi:hypothetical protein
MPRRRCSTLPLPVCSSCSSGSGNPKRARPGPRGTQSLPSSGFSCCSRCCARRRSRPGRGPARPGPPTARRDLTGVLLRRLHRLDGLLGGFTEVVPHLVRRLLGDRLHLLLRHLLGLIGELLLVAAGRKQRGAHPSGAEGDQPSGEGVAPGMLSDRLRCLLHPLCRLVFECSRQPVPSALP